MGVSRTRRSLPTAARQPAIDLLKTANPTNFVEHHSDPDVSIEARGSTSHSRDSVKRFVASSEW
jgi:hypothetical protein